jgi:hypothetical protein
LVLQGTQNDAIQKIGGVFKTSPVDQLHYLVVILLISLHLRQASDTERGWVLLMTVQRLQETRVLTSCIFLVLLGHFLDHYAPFLGNCD